MKYGILKVDGVTQAIVRSSYHKPEWDSAEHKRRTLIGPHNLPPKADGLFSEKFWEALQGAERGSHEWAIKMIAVTEALILAGWNAKGIEIPPGELLTDCTVVFDCEREPISILVDSEDIDVQAFPVTTMPGVAHDALRQLLNVSAAKLRSAEMTKDDLLEALKRLFFLGNEALHTKRALSASYQ